MAKVKQKAFVITKLFEEYFARVTSTSWMLWILNRFAASQVTPRVTQLRAIMLQKIASLDEYLWWKEIATEILLQNPTYYVGGMNLRLWRKSTLATWNFQQAAKRNCRLEFSESWEIGDRNILWTFACSNNWRNPIVDLFHFLHTKNFT